MNLQKFTLKRVGRAAEHVDVRARAEDAVLAARDDDRAHLGVLEADALERVGELDVDAEVVRVELERVAGTEAALFLHVHRRCARPRRRARRELELPVDVALGVRLEANGLVGVCGLGHGRPML